MQPRELDSRRAQASRENGKKGGRPRTRPPAPPVDPEKKARASRENGKKGGRPRKTATGETT